MAASGDGSIARERVPGQAESREVLAQAVGVVHAGFGGATDCKEFAASFGECAGAGADAQHFGELDCVEAVDGLSAGAQGASENGGVGAIGETCLRCCE